MDILMTALFTAAGAAAGLAAPGAAEAISKYKRKKRGEVLERNAKYTALWIKIALGVLSAAVWGSAAFYIENPVTCVSLVLIFTAAILFTLIDLRIRIVPNELILVMLPLGAAFQISHLGIKAIVPALICMVVMMGVFSILAGAMGFNKVGAGDVKLAGVMGLALSYPLVFIALAVMAVLFVVYALGGMALKKLTLKSMFAFAPFMMAGLASALVYVIIQIAHLI